MFAFLDDRDGAACGCHAEGLDPEQRAQLDRGRLEAIAAHVASCPSCQARLARERALRSATATSAAAAAPDHLRARVRATLRVTTITTRRLTRG